jgi:hypothetical protein
MFGVYPAMVNPDDPELRRRAQELQAEAEARMRAFYGGPSCLRCKQSAVDPESQTCTCQRDCGNADWCFYRPDDEGDPFAVRML